MKKAQFIFLGKTPNDLITLEEIKEGERIQEMISEIERHLYSLTQDALRASFNRASLRYISEPTIANLQELRDRRAEYARDETDTTVKALVRSALKSNFLNRFSPWAATILNRAIELAVARKKKIIEEEKTRTRQLIGAPLSEHNQIVAEASRVVDQLTVILAGTQRPSSVMTYSTSKIINLFVDGVRTEERPWRATKGKRTVARVVPNQKKSGKPLRARAARPKRKGEARKSRTIPRRVESDGTRNVVSRDQKAFF